jgi:lipid II:glycine glycyltransferase (peptidoglycan interpeptide bridge formation enzyme)
VLIVYQGDEPIAALAWLSATQRVMTVRSGSLPAGYESRAMYLLYDALIRRAIGEGAIELNAGGVPVEASDPAHPQAGLYEFKNGFGGRPVVRHGLDIPLAEIDA